MASSNPVVYYELAELLARRMRRDEVAGIGPLLLLFPDLLVGSGHPKLLPNWQHYKAYVSAFASWTKALVRLLTARPSESVAEMTVSDIATACIWMMNQAQPFEEETWGTQDWFSWAATEQTKQKPHSSSTQLLLLLLLSRPITAAAWKVLGLKAGPRGRSREGDRSSTQSSTKKSVKQTSSCDDCCEMDMGGQASSSGSGLEAAERTRDPQVGGRGPNGDGMEPGGRAMSGSSVETGQQRVSGGRGSEILPRGSSCERQTREWASCGRGMKTGGQSSSSGGVEVGEPAGAGRGVEAKSKAASRYEDDDAPGNRMARNNSSSSTTSQSMVLGEGTKQNGSSSRGGGGIENDERGSSSSTTSAVGEAGDSKGNATRCCCPSCLAGRVPRPNVQLTTQHVRNMMESSPMLGKLLIVALEYICCLYQWHLTSSCVGCSMLPSNDAGDGGQQLPAAAGSMAGAIVEHLLESLTLNTAAAPVVALPEAAAGASAGRGYDGGSGGSCSSTATVGGGSGGSSTAAAVAAPARGGVKPAVIGRPEQLPKRLSTLPQCGLPAAVMQEIAGIGSRWPAKVLALVELPAGEAEQQQLLQELLGVFEVLQEEVPMPVGCGNPMCTDLGGDSELAYKKTCMGCNVVHYCSRECQVAHWESHKGLCKRVQEEQKENEGQKQQARKKKA